MPETTESHGRTSRPGMSPAEILSRELTQASQEHALWTLTAELRHIYGPEAGHISVMASAQTDTGKLTADTLRVLDEDYETLLPDFALVKRAAEVDLDLKDNLTGLTDLDDPERYLGTEEDLGDHLIGSPEFLKLKRALDAWLIFAEAPEHPSWPYREELWSDQLDLPVLLSAEQILNLGLPMYTALRRTMLEKRERARG